MLLTDRVYHDMFEAILRGRVLPGQKFLTEQEAIDLYHVSRITVRRAFAMLEAKHVIRRRQKVGSIVNTAFAASDGALECIAAVVPLKSRFVRSFLAALCGEAASRNIITVLEPAASGAAQNEALIRLVLHGIRDIVLEKTGKHVEVMVYGDGAFKDPVGKIWELADPVVSPAYTSGLEGTPSELKLKYLADNDFADLSGEELRSAIQQEIRKKDADLVGKMVSEGTPPRQLTDLIGSLCDLTSGSGDKGTPIVYIQGYFDNYTAD